MMARKLTLKYVSLLFALIAIIVSCKVKKQKQETVPVNEKTAFYTFAALRDSIKKKTDFKLIKVTIADTKIKYSPDKDKSSNPFYLKFIITDKDSKMVTAFSDHPLFKKFDLYSDSGEIKSKLISLPKAEITIRVPYFEDYKTISITEAVNFKLSTEILIKNEK